MTKAPTTINMMVPQTSGGVRFHHRVRTRVVNSHRGLTRDEKNRCWYSARDFQQMKQAGIALIKNNTAANTTLVEEEELQAVGLEAPQNCKTRRARVQAVKLAVLMEQELLHDCCDGNSTAATNGGHHGRTTSKESSLSIQSQWASQESRQDALRRAEIVSTHVHGEVRMGTSNECMTMESRSAANNMMMMMEYELPPCSSSSSSKNLTVDASLYSSEPGDYHHRHSSRGTHHQHQHQHQPQHHHNRHHHHHQMARPMTTLAHERSMMTTPRA